MRFRSALAGTCFLALATTLIAVPVQDAGNAKASPGESRSSSTG